MKKYILIVRRENQVVVKRFETLEEAYYFYIDEFASWQEKVKFFFQYCGILAYLEDTDLMRVLLDNFLNCVLLVDNSIIYERG